MSDGAELSLLEVLPLGFVRTNIWLPLGIVQTNIWLDNAAIGELKASYRQNRFHVEDLER